MAKAEAYVFPVPPRVKGVMGRFLIFFLIVLLFSCILIMVVRK